MTRQHGVCTLRTDWPPRASHCVRLLRACTWQPVGLPVPWDGCGEATQFRAPSFSRWSSFFTIGTAEQQASIVKLKASDDFEHRACGRMFQGPCVRCGGDVYLDDCRMEMGNFQHTVCPPAAVGQGVKELQLQASSNSAVNSFDRSIIITIDPLVVLENRLAGEIVVWQRLQHPRAPRSILAPGDTRPFLIHGPRAECRLSVNLGADGIAESCPMFAPEEGWGRQFAGNREGVEGREASCGSALSSHPILLRSSSGRLLLASWRLQGYNTACVSIGDVVNAVPHR